MVLRPLQTRSGPTCVSSTRPTLEPQPSNERMKIMATHSSAIALAETPHATSHEDDLRKEKVEALAEIICAAGEEPLPPCSCS